MSIRKDSINKPPTPPYPPVPPPIRIVNEGLSSFNLLGLIPRSSASAFKK